MINLVLFGPPGAGKGTQAERLVDRYSLVHLSTGDVFRRNIKGETELGKLAQTFMNRGELVPDHVTIKMLEAEVLNHPEAKGFIFDGFPRTMPQAEALDKFLASKDQSITIMVALSVKDEELKSRLLKRGSTSGRADDADPKVIENRISVYKNETAPVAGYYQNKGKYAEIDGMGTIDEISERLYRAIDKNGK